MHVRVAFAESELSKAKPEVGERPPVTHSGFIVYCLVLKMFVVLREKQGGSFNRNCVFNTLFQRKLKDRNVFNSKYSYTFITFADKSNIKSPY